MEPPSLPTVNPHCSFFSMTLVLGMDECMAFGWLGTEEEISGAWAPGCSGVHRGTNYRSARANCIYIYTCHMAGFGGCQCILDTYTHYLHSLCSSAVKPVLSWSTNHDAGMSHSWGRV
jgi:hypothetical protein